MVEEGLRGAQTRGVEPLTAYLRSLGEGGERAGRIRNVRLMRMRWEGWQAVETEEVVRWVQRLLLVLSVTLLGLPERVEEQEGRKEGTLLYIESRLFACSDGSGATNAT
jgi:hypothetical protein